MRPGAQQSPRWRGRNPGLASRLHPAVRLVFPVRRPAETPAYLERAAAEAQSLARGKSRSPRPPPPSSQVSVARRGPGRPGSAPASPFSSDAFDPQALRRTSAPELPGSARGDPGNRPRFISFHQAALGSLETAEPVIAFFQEARCGLDNSQSAPCLHLVMDSPLAKCQPIVTVLQKQGRRGKRGDHRSQI